MKKMSYSQYKVKNTGTQFLKGDIKKDACKGKIDKGGDLRAAKTGGPKAKGAL